MTSNYYKEILEHYNNPKVQSEIAEFCKNRWVGVQCETLDTHGKKVLVRYLGRRRIPLQIHHPMDVKNLVLRFISLKPRTIYATANLYKRLTKEEDVVNLSNIEACMPTWDVDNNLENWDATVQTVKEIISTLESYGVTKSVFVKFSGRGAHVHIHPYAISENLRRKHNPLDLAYAIVEYVREKIHRKVLDIAVRFKAEKLRVDNEIDPQRLFVSPLSIHRENLKVSVCINPRKIEEFNPEEDAKLAKFNHYEGWKSYEEGEANELAEKAYEFVGGYPTLPKPRRRKHPPVDKQIIKWLSLTGFEDRKE